MSLRWLLPLTCLATCIAQTPNVAGDYSGMLGPLHIKLHCEQAGTEALTCTLDSTDQGAMGLRCANVHLQEKNLTFDVSSVGGKWHGTISADTGTLSGLWSQGAEIPLVFQHEPTFLAAATPSRVDGIWLGAIDANGTKLRLQAHITSDRAGKEYCTVDSLDQSAMVLPCDNVQFQGNHFSFDLSLVHGHWTGTLSDSGNELHGVWSQGTDLPLDLTRQAKAIEPKKPEAPKYDPATPAVPVAELKAVLDRDLASVLAHGSLAPSSSGGVVVGVVQHGTRRTFVYGPVHEDSLFEIGSISKTFTGLILAQMVQQEKVKFDDPVRELLPSGTVPKPNGAEITLLDLATQHSGLPRMPDNFHPADAQDPYADYRSANLYDFINKHGVQKPVDTSFLYSNLGFGLLGQALADAPSCRTPNCSNSKSLSL